MQKSNSMMTEVTVGSRFLRTLIVLLIFGSGTMLTVGCGSSQEDLMMRAARRSRPKTDNEKADPGLQKLENIQASKKQAIGAGKTQGNKVSALVPDREKPENEKEKPKSLLTGEEIEEPSEITILPIEERKPESGLSGKAGRARAAENIDKIGKALIKYHNDNDIFPRTFSETATGIPTLSWRVE